MALYIPGRPKLITGNPLAYPAGVAPGVNWQHPALNAAPLRFSGVATATGNFVSLYPNYKAGTNTSTINKVFDSVVGPSVSGVVASASRILFANQWTTNDATVTFGGVFRTGVTPSATAFVFCSGNTGAAGLTAQISTANALSITIPFSTAWATGITLAASTPYFLAASITSGTQNLVLLNLATGQIKTATGTTAFAFVAPNGTVTMLNIGNDTNAFNGNLAASMFSAGLLGLAQLQQWAADPWSFWYPAPLWQRIPVVGKVASGSATGTCTGVSTAPGIGQALWAEVGTCTGVTTAPAIGQASAASIGTATGVTTVPGKGQSTVAGVGLANPATTAPALSTAAASGVGLANPLATAPGIGQSTWAEVGTAAGVTTAPGISAAAESTAGTANGTGTAPAIGQSTWAEVGTATGIAAAPGIYQAGSTVGTCTGIGTAPAIGQATVKAIGTATGATTAPAIGQETIASVGTATGVTTAPGIAAVGNAVGTATGTATAPGLPPTPITIFGTNLVAWYDAQTGVTQSSGNVSAWADQSSNAYNFSNTGTGSPTYSSTGFNSVFPGITLGNSLNQLSSPQFNINVGTASAFMVVKTPSTYNGDARWLAYFIGSSGADYNVPAAVLLFASDIGGGFEAFHDNTQVTQSISTSTNARCGITYSGGGVLTPYLNNVAGTTATATADTLGTSTNQLYLGGTLAGSGETGLVVAEIVFVNVVATTAQLNALDNYFTARWGLVGSAVATGTATGVTTAPAIGQEKVASVGTATGVTSAPGISAAGTATGTCTGAGTAPAIGRSIVAGVGTAAGVTTAPGISPSVSGSGVGTATGTGSAPGIGKSTVAAVGTAVGTGTAPAIGNVAHGMTAFQPNAFQSNLKAFQIAAQTSGVGTATGSGVGSASAIGKALVKAVATATGSGTAPGISASNPSVATATGTATAPGIGQAAASVVATATGTATAPAVGSGFNSMAKAHGVGTAAAIGQVAIVAVGEADGVGAAPGVNTIVITGVGRADGVGAALGLSVQPNFNLAGTDTTLTRLPAGPYFSRKRFEEILAALERKIEVTPKPKVRRKIEGILEIAQGAALIADDGITSIVARAASAQNFKTLAKAERDLRAYIEDMEEEEIIMLLAA